MACRPLLIAFICVAIGAAPTIALKAGAGFDGPIPKVEGATSQEQDQFTEVSTMFCNQVNGIVKNVFSFYRDNFTADRIEFDGVQDVLAYNNVTVEPVHIPTDMTCERASAGTLDLKFGYKADTQTFRANPVCGMGAEKAVRMQMTRQLPDIDGDWRAVFMTVRAQREYNNTGVNCTGDIILGITEDNKDGENVQELIGNCGGPAGTPLTGVNHAPGLFREFRDQRFGTTGIYLFAEVRPGLYSVTELVYEIDGVASLRKNDRLEELKLTDTSTDSLSYELSKCNSSTARTAPTGAQSPLFNLAADRRPTARDMYNYVALLQKLYNDGVW